MKTRKTVVFLLLLAAIAAYVFFDLGQYLNLAYLKSSQQAFRHYYETQPAQAIALYTLIYIAATALSLPGASVLTLAGGALFGVVTGTLIVSFAASIGATLAFLTSRHLLRSWVRERFRGKLEAIDAGIVRDGAFYLFSLRLVPLFPFFVINLLMGLTAIRTWTFYWVSQVGMLAGTVAYVNAGTQLAQIDSARGILSPGVIGSFVLLGLFPLLARKLLQAIQARQVYRKWTRPARFDRNLIVIGAGAAGLVTSYIAAVVKAKVTLVEGHKMGGDCLNFGCVPSKALIRSANFVRQARDAQSLGIARADLVFDFADVMARIHRVIGDIEPHDSVERYTKLGVDVVQGTAKIVSPWEVEIDGRRLSTRAIVIAAGARPFVPPIPGIEEVGYLTSDTLWSLRELPRRMVVLGGGPIGCELAQAFARFGVAVTQVEKAPRVLGREDPDVSSLVAQSLKRDDIVLMTGHEAIRCERDGENKRLVVRNDADGTEAAIEFDLLLCAVGRVARTEGYGLEELGIALTPRKTIQTDGFLQTLYPNIYACGDVAGPYQFTHTAAHQAWYAAVNALFGQFRRFRVDYSVIPWCTFTSPEVARVGLSETEAREQQVGVEVTRFALHELDRAIADGTTEGFIKVLTVPGKDKILGVTIVGEHAGDLLAEYVLAMKHGLGLNKILGTIHTYPTLAEANKYVAGEWKRAHAPQRLLEWVGRYHAWRRGGAAAPAPSAAAGGTHE
ncbi:FAD-dependent oxidoreductase [Lacisediminimonas sp.]|uniref:FAD-dependent oxidoreductase n=1 Tax=Lacisediminimonas sp. TaxID=3060582 RepID=UPI00271AD369|nr:FAD-dependent oxidoreductase [Lacisediminimonas sp.]MDO8300453.1 FAD-dependent oxidoreductase [Lacisediminimonas sp.]